MRECKYSIQEVWIRVRSLARLTLKGEVTFTLFIREMHHPLFLFLRSTVRVPSRKTAYSYHYFRSLFDLANALNFFGRLHNCTSRTDGKEKQKEPK